MGQIMTGSTVPPPYPASASYLTPRHLIFDDIRQFLTQPFMRTFFPSSCYLELRLLNLIKGADFLKLLFDDMSLHSDFHQVFVLLFSKLFSNHRLYFQTSISDMQRKELNRGVCKIFITSDPNESKISQQFGGTSPPLRFTWQMLVPRQVVFFSSSSASPSTCKFNKWDYRIAVQNCMHCCNVLILHKSINLLNLFKTKTSERSP